ncbi:MAG TPA: hypothetical protein VFS43_33450 [Polyangiaceae bacterium]|nr:hypothetical protein [Polyangiaceae bacterium]
MALKNMSTETMLALSAAWTDPQRDRPALGASVAAPLLPKLDAAHEGLAATAQPATAAEAERELAELQAKEAEIDRVHDRKVRGTFYVLTGLAELADDPEVAESRLDLRDALIPAGLAATQRTYLEEAGDVEALPKRLDDDHREELGQVAVGDGRTLADEVDAWTSSARQLGELEAKRAELVAKRAAAAPERSSSVARARNRWARVVKAIAQAIELDDTIAPRLDEAFLTPLRLAEAKADRKARGARASGEGDAPAGGEAGEGAAI